MRTRDNLLARPVYPRHLGTDRLRTTGRTCATPDPPCAIADAAWPGQPQATCAGGPGGRAQPTRNTSMTQAQAQLQTVPPSWPHRLPPQSHLQDTLHEPHHKARDAIILALAASPHPDHYKHALRLADCACAAKLYVDPDTQSARPWIWRCASPLCPFCARKRAAKVRAQLDTAVAAMHQPRILVLTVKSNDKPLRDQMTHLTRSFARLRHTAYWKNHAKGGVYTVEVTFNHQTHQWHPHLHIMFDGSYLPQPELRPLWHEITGDSDIIWLEAVRNRNNAVAELTKYISKPSRLATWPADAIREYATATAGRRFLGSFGSLYRLRLDTSDKPVPFGPATVAVSITALARQANEGNETAQRLIPIVAALWPLFARYLWSECAQLEPPESAAHRALRLAALREGRPPPQPPPPLSADTRDDYERQAASLLFKLATDTANAQTPWAA